MSRAARLAGLALISSVAVPAHATPTVPGGVVELVAGAREDARAGDRFWPGYADAPFGLVYVADDGEVLLCDRRVPEGFTPAPRNIRLGCAVATGPKSWRSTGFLAAMPAFGPPSVIVMGSPAATGRTAEQWRLTVLHEHFHQWQAMLADYYPRVAALDLAGGDETGMWMLQFPFPYDKPETGAAFARASALLRQALQADAGALRPAARAYWAARQALASSVTEREWRYFEFQLWQEGVARWTEIAVGEASADPATATAARALRAETLAKLAGQNLATERREVVYAFGAGEAMLLDRIDPDWRGCYRVVLELGACWRGLLPDAESGAKQD